MFRSIFIILILLSGVVRSQNLSFDHLSSILSNDSNFGVEFQVSEGFGSRVTPIGDLNQDGVDDIIVSSPTKNSAQGAIYVLFLNEEGGVGSYTEISENKGGLNHTFTGFAYFGKDIDTIGDLDNDGVIDIVVGAQEHGTQYHGAVFILFLKRDGTVKDFQLIGPNTGGYNDSGYKQRFGVSVCNAGDLNNDGTNDLLVGESLDAQTGLNMGAINVLFLDTSGIVLSHKKIVADGSFFSGGVQEARLGLYIDKIGDIDNNGYEDFIIGTNVGQVWVTRMGINQTILSTSLIDATNPILGNRIKANSQFGEGLGTCIDFDHDGIQEFSIGSLGGPSGVKGEVYICYINSAGELQEVDIVNDTTINGLSIVGDGGYFGANCNYIGDLNNDGYPEFAIGENKNSEIAHHAGALHFISLKPKKCFNNECVWPGDANNDGVANGKDLFNIALNYNQTDNSKKRILPNPNWYEQYGNDWGALKYNENLKFSDCNGDGTINNDDALLIGKNYGEVQAKTESFIELDPNGPPIRIVANKDSVSASDSVDFSIYVGDQLTQAENMYGVSMFLRHTNSSVFNSSNKAFFNNSWLGTEGIDMLTLQQEFSDGIDISLSRNNQQNMTGDGLLASVRIIVPDNLGEIYPKDLILKITDLLIISYEEDTILPSEITIDTVTVLPDISTGIQSLGAFQSKLYPNPTTGVIKIESKVIISKVIISDLRGQTVKSLVLNNQSNVVVNLNSVSKGIYFANIVSSGTQEKIRFILK